MSNNIKVAIKVRPLIAREKRNKIEEQWTVTQNSIVSKNPLQASVYHFDHVFGKESNNRDVFEIIANPIVKQCLEGYNGTIFAYGQTSSGKTHTMIGNDVDPGITALAVRQLFEENESDRTFMIRVGYIEIYNEKVYDLLNERKQVTINQNGDNDVRLTNKEEIVSDGDTILNILTQGNRLRKAAQTNMNELSSRSHAIFRIIIESEDANGNGPVRVSYLNLVDLAGSEKATDANNETRLKEGNDINKSLLHLGICIRALSEGKRFVDVRSSKLTRILQASLGGNAYTAIVCNITPGAIEETASTLGFANQAKTIVNEAKCNEVYSPEEAIMKQMQSEVARLKTELELSAENEKKLRAEIATKESNFLSGKDMRVVKVDRRKTWHHMPGDNFQPISMIPRGPIGKVTLKIRPSSDSSTPQPDLLKTPREFRIPSSCDTPSPMQATLKYRLGRVEKEYSDLQQFTSLEARFDLCADALKKDGLIEKLEMELKIAREEVEHYRQMNCDKLTNGISNSNGMIEPVSNGGTDSSAIVNELQAAKDKNNELIQKIAELQSTFDKEKKNLDQRFKAAKDAREKAEILQAEGEITFEQYKKQTNRRINELISEVESLKVNSIVKPVDLNISKMPIKVEPANSYELTELKFELDQLKMDRERQRKSIESLQSNLSSLTDERNAIKSEYAEASARNDKIIAELESQLKELVEEKSASKTEMLNLNNRIVEDLELKVKTVTEEKNVLQSEHTDTSARSKKIIGDLESQLQMLHTEQTEISASHANNLKDLESQLEAMWEERNVLSEKSTLNSKIIEELKKEVETVTEARNNLELEKSEALGKYEKNIADLEAQLKILQSVKLEEAARHEANINDLEAQLQIMTDERNVLELKIAEPDSSSETINDLKSQVQTLTLERNTLQSEHSELSVSNAKIIKDMQSELDAVIEEKKGLESENSDLSTQIMEYIEELDALKSQLDSMGNLQTKFDDLQKIYDDNLQVIEKTEEECKAFKASLLESYDKIKISMEETESLKRRNSSLSVEVSNLKNLVSTKSAEVEDLKKKAEELQQQNEMLGSEVKDDQVEALQKKHREDIAEMEDFYKKLTDQQMADVKKLQATVVQLQSELTDKDKQSCELQSGLKKELQAKQQQIDDYETGMSELRTQLSEMKSKMQLEQQQLQETMNQLQSELNDKKQQSSELQSDLKNELQVKREQVVNNEKTISDLRSELLELQETLDQFQLESNDKEKRSFELQSDFRNDLQEKQKQIVDYETSISELRSELVELKDTIVQLKSELSNKEEQIVNFEKAISSVKSESSELKGALQLTEQKLQDTIVQLQSELNDKVKQSCGLQSDLKKELQEKQQQVDNYETIITDLRSELLDSKTKMQTDHQQKETQLQGTIMQFQSELNSTGQLVVDLEKVISLLKSELAEVKAKLQLEQQQAQQNVQGTIDQLHSDLNDKETAISHLNSELSELKKQSSGFQSDLKSLQLDLQEKQQHLDHSASAISGLRSELLDMNAKLQVKQQESESNDDIVAKLQAELKDKAKNELTAKHVIETLENQLSHETDEQKKHSPKSMKMNVNADRKARRYSQHDESRIWLDDTVEPPRSVESQTDPSDQNCSCESMNIKIVELKQTVAIKTAVINTQRLEMENHPLISKNKDLKKELDEMKAEADLLHRDVDHYKAKLQREKKSRECSCRNRVMESKEVQCSQDSDTETVTNGQSGVSNSQHPNVYNLDSDLQLYYVKTIPMKYREATAKIIKLEESNKEAQKKSNFYKELALSRRADVKKLEAELARRTAAPTSESSSSSTDTKPE
ncbi:kinesin-like protein KIN-7I isoform X2 [Bradysia coprophila]|uniref:kinesin-like protein KIN-7I isoform X2 n=1 Tax=Bradysia coprophila TaxID=38358 RepID=UPI00187D7549|nr:kinesin-like protein KIN-7I isoform X2 [Bradysia coprophila]